MKTLVIGINERIWNEEKKIVGYYKLDGQEKEEITAETTTKYQKMMKEEKIEQRRLWINDNGNPSHSA
jgi:hypothetical protein